MGSKREIGDGRYMERERCGEREREREREMWGERERESERGDVKE